MVKLARTWKTVPEQNRCEITSPHFDKYVSDDFLCFTFHCFHHKHIKTAAVMLQNFKFYAYQSVPQH